MFSGSERAVHYLDRLTLLSDKLFGVKGAMTSFYPFHTNEEFSLNFELQMTGSMKDKEDGFMFLMGSQPFQSIHLNVPSRYEKLPGFENKLKAV